MFEIHHQKSDGEDTGIPEMASAESTQLQSPILWSSTRKWLTITTACLVCFAVSIDSTAVVSAADTICAEFGVDETHFPFSLFLITVWTGTAAFLPLFVYPAMEDFGVRKIYIFTFVIFLIAVIVQAVTPSFSGLLVARLFAGAAGGVLQNAVDGIAADVWGYDIHRRAFSISIYVFSLLAGVTLGSVFGGLVVLTMSWRWILYIESMVYFALIPYIYLTLTEIRPVNDRLQLSNQEKPPLRTLVPEFLDQVLLRGLRMLFGEFIVGTFTLWSSFAFGTVFMLAAAIPYVCKELYGWNTAQGGLIQGSLFIGELVGLICCAVQDKFVYPRFTSHKPNPEARLYLSLPATLIGITAGIFIYAWTSSMSMSWMILAGSLILVGFGITSVVQAVAVYVTDCYGKQAASAISAVAFGENIFAAFLPLGAYPLYEKLGLNWAGNTLGFIALSLSLAPILLVIFGRRIRGRSRYLNSQFSK